MFFTSYSSYMVLFKLRNRYFFIHFVLIVHSTYKHSEIYHFALDVWLLTSQIKNTTAFWGTDVSSSSGGKRRGWLYLGVPQRKKAQHRRSFSIFYLILPTFPVSEMLCILSPGKRGNIAKNLDGLQIWLVHLPLYFCLLSDLPVHSTKLGYYCIIMIVSW